MDFRNPIVAGEELVIDAIRSQNYSEAISGWRIGSDGSVQFSNVNALGDLGITGQVSADKFIVGENGLFLPGNRDVSDMLEANRWDADLDGPYPYGPVGPKGIVGYYSGAPSGTFSGSETGVIAATFAYEPLRRYLIVSNIRITQSLAADQWYVRYRWTNNNQIPTTASAILRVNILPTTGAIGLSPPSFTYTSGFNPGAAYLGLFLVRLSGTGTATITTNVENICDLTVIDIGPASGVGEGLFSKRGGIDTYTNPGSTYSAPTAPPASTPKSYSKVYQPVWSRTYDGDSSTTWDDSAHCYQGYYSSDRGSTRSLVGYNYTTIQSDLSGATVNKVYLNFKCLHAYYSAGMDLWYGAHNYTSKPSSWSGGNVFERLADSTGIKGGSSYTADLTSYLGASLKSGAYRGIAFGPAPSTSHTHYGYLSGATESGKPTLTIQYTK
jgi:hypothetical protein